MHNSGVEDQLYFSGIVEMAIQGGGYRAQGMSAQPVGAALQPVAYTQPPSVARQVPLTAISDVSQEPAGVRQLTDRLSQHVLRLFRVARDWRISSGIEARLEDCQRRRAGMIDDAKLAAIRAISASEINANITDTKISALVAWVQEVLGGQDERPWELTPTPLADIPPDAVAEIEQRVIAAFLPDYQAIMQAAQGMDPQGVQDLMAQLMQRVQDAAVQLREQIAHQIEAEAKKRAEALTVKVADQLEEGGWSDALSKCIIQLSTYPCAWLKGPILQGRRTLRWSPDGTQQDVVIEPHIAVSCPSAWDVFPSPHARPGNLDYVCERVKYSAADLEVLAQSPGWLGWRIQEILRQYTQTYTPPRRHTETNTVQAEIEVTPTEGSVTNEFTSQLEGIEVWATVPGSLLLDWASYNEADLTQFGFSWGIKPTSWYSITAIQIGDWCVKIAPNRDPLGELPYNRVCFDPAEDSIYGKALPEKMAPSQDGFAGMTRAILNNAAMSSGPMIAHDVSISNEIPAIKPWLIVPFNGANSPGGRPPITFFNPQSFVLEFRQVRQDFLDQADNETGVPRYEYGDSDVQGAGSTATGLAALMRASARGVKRVLRSLDQDGIRCVIARLIRWNNMYATDPTLKGDVNVRARGAMAILTKELNASKQNEFMALATNPVYAPLFTREGLLYMLRQKAKEAEWPEDKILVTNEQLQMQMQLEQQMLLEGPPPGQEGEGSDGSDKSKSQNGDKQQSKPQQRKQAVPQQPQAIGAR